MKGLLIVCLSVLSLSGCSDSPPGETGIAAGTAEEEETTTGTLSGSVLYRERIALPPGAVVRVTLEDSSRMDVAATALASDEIPAEGAPPYAFALDYDPAAITEKGRYGLRAKIEAEGALLFTSTEFIPAFDDSRPGPVEILVRRTPGKTEAKPDPGASAGPLADTRWKISEINGVPTIPGNQQQPLEIGFSGETVAGFAGCNRFTGSFAVSGSSLRLGPLAATQKAAIDPEIGAQERALLSALDAVASFALEGSTLLLKDSNATTLVQGTAF